MVIVAGLHVCLNNNNMRTRKSAATYQNLLPNIHMAKFALLILVIISAWKTGTSQSSYSCIDGNSTFWYTTTAKNGDAYSMANVSAGLCYGNFSNGAPDNSSQAGKICDGLGGHSAVAYTLEEFQTLANFVSRVNASLLMTNLLSSGTSLQSILRYPFWIGLRRNESNLSILYWKDHCQNPTYQTGIFSIRDVISNNRSYTLDFDGYNSYNSSSFLPHFICRKNFNKCGSNPCQNGGICINYGQCFYCNCSSNFAGDFCQFKLSSIYNSAKKAYTSAQNSSSTMVNFIQNTPTNGIIYSNIYSSHTASSSSIMNDSTFLASTQAQIATTDSQETMDVNTTTHNSMDTSTSGNYIDSVPVSTIRVRTWRVHYLMTTTEQLPNTTVYVTKKIFNAFNLSKTTWFAMGLAAFLALIVLIIICNCICGPPQPKYEPFT